MRSLHTAFTPFPSDGWSWYTSLHYSRRRRMEGYVQEKVLFDVWCLVNPDFRQIAKRVLIGNRRDLNSTEVASQLNDHINADTPMLLAQSKKLRYWNSLIANMPPWAREVYLYVHGLKPGDEGLDRCDTHHVHYTGACPLCEPT